MRNAALCTLRPQSAPVASGVGTLICLAVPAVFWLSDSQCPSPELLLLDVTAVGLAGLWEIFRRATHRGLGNGWLAWLLCGGVLAASVIGIATIGPWIFPAALAFAVAGAIRDDDGSAAPWFVWSLWAASGVLLVTAIVGLQDALAVWMALAALAVGAIGIAVALARSPQRLARSAAVFTAVVSNFVFLFALAKDSEIEVVNIPAGSLVEEVFERVDYADAYRAKLPAGRQYDAEALALGWLAAASPCWARRTDPEPELSSFAELETREAARWTRVYERSSNEIVIGNDDYHLNYRVSILLTGSGDAQWVTVSTLVHYNNWSGRAYFIPVRVGHQIILPQTVHNLVHSLR
jgi:hypothetical protein